MSQPADPTQLRDRLAEDAALRLNGPANDGRGWYRNDTERTQCYAQADAVLAVIQHDLESLEQQAANARAVARDANRRAGSAVSDLEAWDELRAQAHEQMRAGFAESIRGKWDAEASAPDADMAADAVIDYLENEYAGQLAKVTTERNKAMAGVPLVCADDRHQAKVRGLEAEVRGLEETAAGHQQNALHWQERAEDADRMLDQASDEVERLNADLAGWEIYNDAPARAVDSTPDISDYEEAQP